MIDFNALKPLVIGAITAPRAGWEAQRDKAPETQTVLLGYTLPVVVGTTVVAALLSFILGTQDFLFSGVGRSFLGMLREMVLGSLLAVAGLAVLAYVVLALARVFGGHGTYAAALTMVSLVATPALLAGIPGALPWIGWIISLAAAIYSLVLLYQAIPVFLSVEGGKRPLHFIATLAAIIVVNLILGALFGGGGRDERATSEIASGSSFGISAALELREQAEADRYAPPANGQVTDAQLQRLIKVAEQTALRRQRAMAELEKASPQVEEGEGFAAMARALGGLSGAAGAGMRAMNAEIEAVKQENGNWAEHQWVRDQLGAARYGVETGPGSAQNRALYERHQSAVDRALDQLQQG